MKLVAGIGICNIGKYPAAINRRDTIEYILWNSMLNRCKVGGSIQRKQPAYIGCSVHPDWIKFQDFAEWCNKQIGFGLKGWQLDKDILVQGNKVYGPDTCCFVPRQLNSLLNHRKSDQGLYPTGVTFDQKANKYRVQISLNGRPNRLGYFTDLLTASDVYRGAKANEIYKQAEIWKSQIDPRVYTALLTYQV